MHIDPLTLNLIDSNTLILLNKVDALPLSPSHTSAVVRALESAGKSWLGHGSEAPFWELSVKTETGLREFAKGLTEVLKHRCVALNP